MDTAQRLARDAKIEADMSRTPEERGEAMQDIGAITTPVPPQLKDLGLTGEVRPMRDSFILKGLTVGERVDAATSDLPTEIETWTLDEIKNVEAAIYELHRYCRKARLAGLERGEW